ncbi:MAG: hypothetical protein A3C51_04405 [Omnitrophica bacterium RIFCSPHIGHO2_02_FULL_46_20]|nr:MAG: hypothetical protein A3C51_04405 [Omnitrophica bacterium RIFCSPHIGHO2_02_FULL_46_20]
MVTLRTIVREKRFEEELAALEPDLKRADEFLRAVEWALARDPSAGEQIPQTPVHICSMSSIRGNPPNLVVYYTFNDDYVILLSIKSFKE